MSRVVSVILVAAVSLMLALSIGQRIQSYDRHLFDNLNRQLERAFK